MGIATSYSQPIAKRQEETLFAAVATVAGERRLSEFNGQGLANGVWAFATAK
jgi:hypothetical protein